MNPTVSVEKSTNSERNKSLSDAAKLVAESPLSTDDMHTGPSVTSRKGSKTCGYLFRK